MRPVSVIVTAYNVEAYIRDTVRSIQAQTMSDLEIIVVDDGSADGTGRILDSLAAGDDRVVILHRDNGGVSAARNSGLAAASGEFVLFVDGDDLLLPAACESLLGKARAENADIVVSDYLTRNEAGAGDSLQSGGSFADLPGKAFGRLLLRPYFTVALWNKLVRRRLFEDHAVRFPVEISLGEDMAALFELTCSARTVVKLDEPTLVYIRRRGGLASRVSAHHFTVAAAMDRIERLLHKHYDITEELSEEYRTACYYAVLYTRVIHCHTYDDVHRKLYDWYTAKRFAHAGPRLDQFIARLPARERLIARGYRRSYQAGVALSRITDLARSVKSPSRRK
jgi:glycosyltransferase involved in cell wall biosynthesis